MTDQPYLSFVIPVYNEEERVHKAIEALDGYLEKLNREVEIIFVDDGSVDRTKEKIKELSPAFNYRILDYQPNRGKGYAVKHGMLNSKGKYRLFMDVDMSTPIEELEKFLPKVEEGAEVVIGTRKTVGANLIKRQNFLRQKLGEGFTLLSNTLIVPGVSDFTCGFKLFSQEASQDIFQRQQIERWGFDSEIMFLAHKHGYEITEVPVSWTNDEATRVNLFKDIFQSLSDLISIRLNDLQGYYD